MLCFCQVLRRKYGKEADIWSCGVMLYILLSGMPPFYGDNEQQIFDSILRNKVDFASDPWPKVSEPAKVRQQGHCQCSGKLSCLWICTAGKGKEGPSKHRSLLRVR
jgi:serine/threonine protein kinase